MPRRYPPSDLPAMTADELRDIWTRLRHPDVRDLLWEIARLQHQVRYAHWLCRLLLKLEDGVYAATARSWLAKLDLEPCVLDELQADYASEIPGSRGWSKQMPTADEEVVFAQVAQTARLRIAKRRRRDLQIIESKGPDERVRTKNSSSSK